MPSAPNLFRWGAEIKWLIVTRTLLEFIHGKCIHGEKDWSSGEGGDAAGRAYASGGGDLVRHASCVVVVCEGFPCAVVGSNWICFLGFGAAGRDGSGAGIPQSGRESGEHEQGLGGRGAYGSVCLFWGYVVLAGAEAAGLGGLPPLSLSRVRPKSRFLRAEALRDDKFLIVFWKNAARNLESHDLKNHQKLKVRAVVFDYGKVLSLDQAPGAVEEMARLCNLPLDVFCERYWHTRLAYDRADLNGKSYWESVAREQACVLTPGVLEELYRVDSEGWANSNPVMLRWVDQLRLAGVRMALLSNMPLEVSLFLVKNRKWLALFDPLIFSCDVRSVKPEEAIYRNCLERLQVAPEEVLFLDDKLHNVEGARQLGMHSLVFETAENTLPLIRDQFDLPMLDEVLALPV